MGGLAGSLSRGRYALISCRLPLGWHQGLLLRAALVSGCNAKRQLSHHQQTTQQLFAPLEDATPFCPRLINAGLPTQICVGSRWWERSCKSCVAQDSTNNLPEKPECLLSSPATLHSFNTHMREALSTRSRCPNLNPNPRSLIPYPKLPQWRSLAAPSDMPASMSTISEATNKFGYSNVDQPTLSILAVAVGSSTSSFFASGQGWSPGNTADA